MLVAACERALAEVGVTRGSSQRVLVACSGGPDSVALLRAVTLLLGPERTAVGHVDHGLRPGSARDAALVAELARRAGLSHRAARLDRPRPDEASLRAARYAALERMRVEVGADWILVGHTRDDQAETVLMRLLRARGFHALGGMPSRNGRVLRPLLDVPRAEARAYAERKGWAFAEDPSNCEPRFLRNRIRKELLPLIERRYAPGVSARWASWTRALPAALGSPAEASTRRASADLDEAAELGSPPDRFAWLPRGVAVDHRPWPPGAPLPRDPSRAVFDASGSGAPRVRPFAAGDRIRPFGAAPGRRKVSDVLSEAGVPRPLRSRFPPVVDGRDEVLWVPGLLRSDRAPVSPATTHVWAFSVGDDPAGERSY